MCGAVRAEPGVENAALSTMLPPDWTKYDSRIYLEGEPRPTRSDPARAPRWQMVTPGYFATMGIPLVRGRALTDHDDSTSASAIVVSESMARAYWPDQSPLGERIGCACDDTTMMTVVGVVGDVRNNGFYRPAAPAIYVPAAVMGVNPMNVVARSDLPADQLIAAVRRTVRQADSTLVMENVRTIHDIVLNTLQLERLS